MTRIMTRLALALALGLSAPAAQALDYTISRKYASVRGWDVVISSIGCMGIRMNRGEGGDFRPYISPFGSWEMLLPNPTNRAQGDVNIHYNVDGRPFPSDGGVEGADVYTVFDLPLRLMFRDGAAVTVSIEGQSWARSLDGVTAMLLKMEECWHVTSGYDAASSSRAGAYAFK